MKLEGQPIKLHTVKGNKRSLYERLMADVFAMNDRYQILPEYLIEDLCADLRQLLFADVADSFRLVFYNPLDIKDVYLEKSYKLSSLGALAAQRTDAFTFTLPTPYEFDIFVLFSKKFLALSVTAKEALLNKCHLKWFDFSRLGLETAEEGSNVDLEEQTDDLAEEASDDTSPWLPYDLPTPAETMGAPRSPGLKDSSLPLTADAGSPVPMQKAAPKGDSAAHSALTPHFFSGKALMIAAYVDSRQLISEFISAADGLGLTPIQWTYAEGFRVLNDKYAGRYSLHDEGFAFVGKKLSPFDALRYIRQETKSRTLYLLEDFHYYIKEENVAGADFAELISVLKSLPDILRKAGSHVVILAPTVDLPPEIAPIFEIIKDKKGQKDLHYLTRFGTDLTKSVLSGKIKPVVGRDREIFECLKILSRMETNNPLLIGKSGVGKTAIVEGLAAALVKSRAPRDFNQRRIIALNLNLMLSGTKYRGEFEKRLEGLLDEVRANAEHVIVFIDEIHTLLGMGQTEGSQGAENILKPVLARGEFPCIGATTYDEYKNFIAPDKALERRFQVVEVAEPTRDETLLILKGVKHVYENHHGVTIHNSALDKCVELAQTLPNEFFPGKAIKMLDSVCASASLVGNDVVTPVYVVEEFNRMHRV